MPARRKIPPTAFAIYVAMGPDRSLRELAEVLGVTKKGVAEHSKRERWQEKIGEIDDKLAESAVEVAIRTTHRTVERMVERHMGAMDRVVHLAYERLTKEGVEFETPMDAVRALDIAVRSQRVMKGEPTDITGDVRRIVQEEAAQLLKPKSAEPKAIDA